MSKYTFETVTYKNQPSVNAFLTSIGFSTFHWHYEYELLMVLRGAVTIRMEMGDYLLKEGDLLLINSKSLHSIAAVERNNICGLVQVDPQLFSSGTNDARQFRFYLNSKEMEEEPEGGFELFRKRIARILLCSLEENDLNFYRLRGEVYGLIADLMDRAEYDIAMKSDKATNDSEQMMEIIEFIRLNLTNPKLQEAIQKEFGISEKTLYRYFKSSLGISPREFIEEMKLQKARRLLQNTDYDMNYIIDSCGFGSEKSFYRIFRKSTGQTPGNYRKAVNGTENINDNIQGYLDYEPYEAESILKSYL
jgi:AraC-like DNA-binding protein